jgi:hypothetical protein
MALGTTTALTTIRQPRGVAVTATTQRISSLIVARRAIPVQRAMAKALSGTGAGTWRTVDHATTARKKTSWSQVATAVVVNAGFVCRAFSSGTERVAAVSYGSGLRTGFLVHVEKPRDVVERCVGLLF